MRHRQKRHTSMMRRAVILVLAGLVVVTVPTLVADAESEWLIELENRGEERNDTTITVTFWKSVVLRSAGEVVKVTFDPGDGTGPQITEDGGNPLSGDQLTSEFTHVYPAPPDGPPVVYIATLQGEAGNGDESNVKELIITLTHPASYIADLPGATLEVENVDDVKSLARQITGVLQAILFAITGIFVVIAGYQYMTAQGDPDKTASARNMVLYAVAAAIIGLLATFLKALTINVLGG